MLEHKPRQLNLSSSNSPLNNSMIRKSLDLREQILKKFPYENQGSDYVLPEMFPKIGQKFDNRAMAGRNKYYYQLNAHNQDNIYVGHSNTIVRPTVI